MNYCQKIKKKNMENCQKNKTDRKSVLFIKNLLPSII
jgi:hypothetical protein